jgi:hypothetical protein
MFTLTRLRPCHPPPCVGRNRPNLGRDITSALLLQQKRPGPERKHRVGA